MAFKKAGRETSEKRKKIVESSVRTVREQRECKDISVSEWKQFYGPVLCMFTQKEVPLSPVIHK